MVTSNNIKFFLICSAIFLAGCGDRYVVSEMQVQRTGWDTLSVDAGFLERDIFGNMTAVEYPDVTVNLFDANFDTLYTGADLRVAVPDRELGDAEKLLVELCASFGSNIVCEQRGLSASPKKFSVEQEIDYPSENDYDRGEYTAQFRLDRLRYGTEEWEQIELPPTFSRYLIASIDSADGGSIQVPLRRHSGRFNLASMENYRDFRYFLLSNLLDNNAATVRFDIYASNRGQPAILATERRTVKTKSRQTRELEAGMFMQEASRRILSGLRTFPIGSEEYAYLDSWSFIKVTERYVIEMDLSWRSRFIRERWYSLKGVLEVNEDGTEPTFRVVRGNSRAMRRWRDRFSGDTITLSDLGVKTDGAAGEGRSDDSDSERRGF